MGAGLLLSGFVHVLGAAVFLLGRVVHLHRNASERIDVASDPVSKDQVVDGKVE